MAQWFSVGLPLTFCGNPVEPRWSERSLDDLSVDELGVSRRYSSLRLTICTVACSPKTSCTPSWTLELVVCRVATQRQTGGGDHEPDPAGTDEWA